MSDTFLLKINQKYGLFSSQEISAFTPVQLLSIGVACIEAQRKQLLQDAQKGGDKTYRGRKIVDALEISLSKLEEKIPDLREQAHTLAFGRKILN